MKTIELNPGAQVAFVGNDKRASAYIGGLGSGKTFAGIARGLQFSQQPLVGYWGPRGVIATVNWPALRDIVLPLFFEIMDGSGLWKTGSQETSYIKSEKTARLKANCGCANRTKCRHVSEILFRSLDEPNWMRGIELSWFFIDEGRNVDGESWNILYGRLRQKGYKHAGWVCSTPNGFDWMWMKFHPDSKNRLPDSVWFGAPTFENRRNVGDDYINSLLGTYTGRFLRQEVYGEFVGVVEGAVFFEWDARRHVKPLEFNPDLPLYSFWDFGMGDLGVVAYGQLEWRRVRPEGATKEVEVPYLYLLDSLESTDRTSGEWAEVHRAYCAEHFGREPLMNICDPAGRQRNVSTGKSIIQDLSAAGVRVVPAPKKPIDFAIRLLNNMLAADRVVVADTADRLAAAFASHKWPVDSDGNKIGATPVHDWTSHFVDAVRYGVTVLIGGMQPRRPDAAPVKTYDPNTYGYIMKQLLEPRGYWLGSDAERPPIEWYPGVIRPRSA
jgi:hypothetical protein